MKTPEPRLFVAILVGVCVLSSAIGAGIGLLAETGPAGTPGKRGPAGPEGPEGPSGAAEVDRLEAEVEDLREQIEEAEDLEGTIEGIESELGELQGAAAEICLEVELLC